MGKYIEIFLAHVSCMIFKFELNDLANIYVPVSVLKRFMYSSVCTKRVVNEKNGHTSINVALYIFIDWLYKNRFICYFYH